ncbi:hypothetical protein ACVW16_007016 [Bradyrhizobium sp. USDA 4474]
MRLPVGSVAVLALILLIPHSANATCLTDAADFAQRICGEVKTRGSSTLIKADGQLSADAKGLLRQFLGSAGAALQGQTELTTYENVLQQQLAGELVDVRQCGIQMAKAAMDQACTKAPNYKTCANAAFGIAGWENQETLQGTSGWRGGGYNPGAYCTDFTNGVVASRGLGSQPHVVENVKPGEEQRRTGFLNSVAEYNYHCSITLRWNPIYNQKADPLCGIE